MTIYEVDAEHYTAEAYEAIAKRDREALARFTEETLPDMWEEWHLAKPGREMHIVIVDTHGQPVSNALARRYWLDKIDREYPE